MRAFYPLLFLILFSCKSVESISKKYIPSYINKEVYFGMPLSDYLSSKEGKTLDIYDEKFRTAIYEPRNDDQLEGVAYYFDKDDDEPLYEIILIFKETTERDKVAKAIFGSPNTEGEWKVTNKSPFNLWAWPYKNKLVIVGLIRDTETEWSDQDW